MTNSTTPDSYHTIMHRWLSSDHPEVHEHFIQGGFSVQLGGKKSFGRIPVDKAIEETVNKEIETPGGTKGFSLNPEAVTRYYLTSEYRSMYLGKLRDMIGRNESRMSHPDLQLSRIQRDEVDIQSLVDLMDTSWINALSPDQAEFVRVFIATLAPPDVAKGLIEIYQFTM